MLVESMFLGKKLKLAHDDRFFFLGVIKGLIIQLNVSNLKFSCLTGFVILIVSILCKLFLVFPLP